MFYPLPCMNTERDRYNIEYLLNSIGRFRRNQRTTHTSWLSLQSSSSDTNSNMYGGSYQDRWGEGWLESWSQHKLVSLDYDA